MRLPGIAGNPDDEDKAKTILNKAVELGVTVIDTADFYGPQLANKHIAGALSPYNDNLILCTKVGVKGTDKGPVGAATRKEIRESVNRNLNSLRVESLDVVFLRLPGGPLKDTGVPLEESISELAELKNKKIVKHVGLSSASVSQIETASNIVDIAAVQNSFCIGNVGSQPVVDFCNAQQIMFMPYFPLNMGKLSTNSALLSIARKHSVTESQIALAWLLSKSPTMVPIPGTSQISHLEENVAAESIVLSKDEQAILDAVA